MKVLWVSRHRPGEEEKRRLAASLDGADIVPVTGTVPDTWSLVQLLDDHKPDVVVATLPLDMQQVLITELKSRSMRPLVRPIYHHRGTAQFEWEFQGFEEVLRIELETRPLPERPM